MFLRTGGTLPGTVLKQTTLAAGCSLGQLERRLGVPSVFYAISAETAGAVAQMVTAAEEGGAAHSIGAHRLRTAFISLSLPCLHPWN